MIKLYDYTDYKDYINDWIQSLSKSRGKYLELAGELGIHTTLISQIFKGERDLNQEQAYQLTEYLGFNDLEKEYFIDLVNYARAGSYKLEEHLLKKIKKLQSELSNIKSRIKHKKVLSEEDKALFYSNWFYSAIRLSTSVEGIDDRDSISKFLNLPMSTVNQVCDYLLSVGLLKIENDKLEMGPSITHLDAKSPLISRHHSNWRVKAMDRHPKLTEDEFCFTGPLTMNEKDLPKVREILVKSIEDISKIVSQSDPVDRLYCVNLDWFKID